ncbi:Hypothetical protein LUCI_2267 [Lucifera butyrica]|uniref:Oxidoreductase n-terminal n=1 Tax=Lucifera butyrica TaxID=1351585 RepID=A0A498RA69_9FIRM|nr:oxidoreductase [Lucifera butyrica]VBB07023.1 Hypothetical protein LUCI_2267 [Lucifera butyrica]
MKKVKIGIIGYGLSGSVFHAPLISTVEGLDLVAVVSSQPEKVRQDFPAVDVVPFVEALLARPDIDLVVVSTPNTTHFSFAKQALEANKHVIVEKPFVTHFQEADELISLAEKQNRLLSVYQNRRWDNDFLTLKQCIREGLLGDIFSYESHYDRFRPQVSGKWRDQALPGSGMLFDLGSHLIDQALHLFGLPCTVFADIQAQRPGAQADDYFHIILGYDRLRVILHSSCLVRKPGPHFQVHGNKGSFIKYGLDPQEGSLAGGIRPGAPDWGRDPADLYGQLTIGTGLDITAPVETLPGSYQSYYQAVYQAITAGSPLPVTAREARNTIKIIETAQESSKTGKIIPFAE